MTPVRSDGATREAIEHHYDVGRDFYGLWLDARKVYSCALWPGELDDDLEAAQLAKLAWHVDAAAAGGVARVLDIGCGWGAMLRYLTEERSVSHATGLTLSSDQAESIEVSDRIEVRLQDWRDHRPVEPYDAVISIGAFEHFTRPELSALDRRAVYATFFNRCADWLNPGGRLSLQTIAYEDYDETTGPVSSFFTDEIFPESALPHLSDIIDASDPWFRLIAYRSDAAQYEHTLHLWQQRLESRRDEALALVGRTTYRRYLRYLRVSRALFDRRTTTLYRLAFERRPTKGRAGSVSADAAGLGDAAAGLGEAAAGGRGSSAGPGDAAAAGLGEAAAGGRGSSAGPGDAAAAGLGEAPAPAAG
jgi:cyclopropane-fatty-acyl-phospholipid synthase